MRTTSTRTRRRTTTRRSRRPTSLRSKISNANGIETLSSWSRVIKYIYEQRRGGDEIYYTQS
eukprot:3225057-Pleurochrysis_carterae.AAC.1